MKERWNRLASRIDALSLRERAMVFAAALVVVVFLGTLLFVDPSTARARVLADQIARQAGEMQTLQAQIAELEKKRADPDAANIARRDQIRANITALDESLKDISASLVPAQKMRSLLQDMLVRSPRLQLVGLRTLPVAPLVDKAAVPDKNASTASALAGASATPVAGSDAGGVYKHGIEIKLQGSYADLYDYLARLEKLDWRMFWAKAALDTKDYPQLTLTVTVYTLSLDKAWLVL